ncbi:MAG: hypothetical protein WD993_02315 [Thermoleophilaceae bacterium]
MTGHAGHAGHAGLPTSGRELSALARGTGHVALHETGVHGGLPARPVAAIFALAAVLGAIVLTAEAIGS